MRDIDDLYEIFSDKAATDSGFAVAFAVLRLSREVGFLRSDLAGSVSGHGLLQEASLRLTSSVDQVAGAIREVAAAFGPE